MSGEFSHLDEEGRARMVNVGAKAPSARVARAEAFVAMSPDLVGRLRSRRLPKGDPFEACRIAGIQGAKKTADLIPLCHPLSLDEVDVRLEMTDEGVRVETTARNHGKTGVEMEAMVGASVAALTLYDMCKGVDKGIEIGPVRLVEKTGGKSGAWRRS